MQRGLGVDRDQADHRAAQVEVGGEPLRMHARDQAQVADQPVAHAQAGALDRELDVGVDHRALEAGLQVERAGVHVARLDRVELAPDLDVAGDHRHVVLPLRAPVQGPVHEVEAGRQPRHVDAHAPAEALDVEASAEVAAGRLLDDQVERRWHVLAVDQAAAGDVGVDHRVRRRPIDRHLRVDQAPQLARRLDPRAQRRQPEVLDVERDLEAARADREGAARQVERDRQLGAGRQLLGHAAYHPERGVGAPAGVQAQATSTSQDPRRTRALIRRPAGPRAGRRRSRARRRDQGGRGRGPG